MSCGAAPVSKCWWEAIIPCGANFDWVFFAKDDGAPLNLTGMTFDAEMKRDTNDETVELDLAPFLFITNAAGGEFALNIPPDETAQLSGRYCFAIDLVFPGNYRVRSAEGIWTARKAATST